MAKTKAICEQVLFERKSSTMPYFATTYYPLHVTDPHPPCHGSHPQKYILGPRIEQGNVALSREAFS